MIAPSANLHNVARALVTLEKLIERRSGLPNFGVFYGPSGFGKTCASICCQNQFNAALIQIGETWSKKKLIQSILHELGEFSPKGTISDLADLAKFRLAEDFQRPLIIDEADLLIDKNMIEIIRELADVSQVPVLLVGEEALPHKLKRIERVHNRVLEFTPALACNDEDVLALKGVMASDISIADDLLEAIKRHSHRVARRVCVNFSRVNDLAAILAVHEIDLNTFHKNGGELYTGEAPARPKGLRV